MQMAAKPQSRELSKAVSAVREGKREEEAAQDHRGLVRWVRTKQRNGRMPGKCKKIQESKENLLRRRWF
jgi:hypothetical protein